MKIRYVIALTCLMATGVQAVEPVVYRWDTVCNHTTATDWFVLPSRESATIEVDLSGCTKEQVGSLLFFGIYGTKAHSRQLSSKHKVRLNLTALYSSGNVADQITSDSGSILADARHLDSPVFVLTAENLNRNKDATIRLRAQLLSP